jgi:hypothetical protein
LNKPPEETGPFTISAESPLHWFKGQIVAGFPWISPDFIGKSHVAEVTTGGATFDFITGLSSPRGLCWDGDQTIYVADEATLEIHGTPRTDLKLYLNVSKSSENLRKSIGEIEFIEPSKAGET